MKVLIDECAPRALKLISRRMVTSALPFKKRAGQEKRTESVLSLAESRFDAMVTLDTNLDYQQNLAVAKLVS
jgi:hypothetical protein